jgi:hypothetical protein
LPRAVPPHRISSRPDREAERGRAGFPGFEELAHDVRAERAHDEPAPARLLDQSLALQTVQRVAHGCPADLQLRGECVHHQPGPGGSAPDSIASLMRR